MHEACSVGNVCLLFCVVVVAVASFLLNGAKALQFQMCAGINMDVNRLDFPSTNRV